MVDLFNGLRQMVRAHWGMVGIMLLVSSYGAHAQGCRVLDPTGTPLNVRSAPNAEIVGTLPNGYWLSVTDTAVDNSGRPWALVAKFETGRRLGWVFRQFINCF
jgi:hypothetical protein